LLNSFCRRFSELESKLIHNWLARRPRYHLHFTPTSASWINQVERFFALLTEKQIRRGVHRSVDELEQAINRFIETHNQAPKPFRWTKSADDILASVKRFCEATTQIHSLVVNTSVRISAERTP